MVQMCKPNYRRKLGITSDMNLILLLIFNQIWLALSTEFLALLYFDHVIIYQASNMCIFLITDMALNCLGLIAIIMVLLCFCLDIRSLAWSYSYITPGIVSSRINANGADTKFLTEVAGIVFTRGPVVAVLILLESNGQTYAVLTEQVRVPVGKFLLELPVGMLDNEKGDFVGTAVREGGCDEEIGLFLYRGPVDEETIRSLQGKETGLRDHGGLIKLRVVPYNQMWRSTADTKALCAIALYEMAKWEGLLPSPSSNL